MRSLMRIEVKADIAYMEVPQCCTCRFWESPAEPGLFGYCRLFSDKGVVRPTREIESAPQRLAAAAPDSGSAECTFATAAGFGCVQWEGKD